MTAKATTESLSDKILKVLEVITLLVLVMGIIIIAFYESYWVFWGDSASPRHARLAAVMIGLNNNWKAALILLIPLFYRTIRGFLERIEEFGGAKAPHPPEPWPQEIPNPPAPTDQGPKLGAKDKGQVNQDEESQ